MPPRDPAWDALRGVAILCVVAAHSVGPYVSRPLPGLLWPVYEPARPLMAGTEGLPGPAITDFVFWTIRTFTVPLFFFIAGAFGAKSLAHTDPRVFARTRLARLLPALLLGLAWMVVVMYPIWAWGWVKFGYAAPGHILHAHFGPAVQRNLHGFGHLWYLWYLILLTCALAWSWPLLRRAVEHPRVPALALRAPVAIGALLILLTPVAAFLPDAVFVFDNSYIPTPGFFLFHAVFFVWGAVASRPLLDAQSPARRTLGNIAPILLITGAIIAVVLTRLITPAMHVMQNQDPPLVPGLQDRLRVGTCAAFGAGAFILGLVGLFTLWQRPPAWLSALGRISLWVYITHLAWVGLAAVLLFRVQIPSEAKAACAFAFSLAVTLTTRALLTRTRIGKWMGA